MVLVSAVDVIVSGLITAKKPEPVNLKRSHMRALTILPLTAAPAFAFAERDLSIYTWGEYTPPDLVAKFEMEFGVKVHIDSLSILDPAEDVKGRINMLRDMNDVINLAERYLGVPRCSESPVDMKRVLDLLETQKEWVKFYDSETKELLVSGEAVGSMIWNGYAMRVRDEKPPITYVYPVERLCWLGGQSGRRHRRVKS